jgi:hypothetical protein
MRPAAITPSNSAAVDPAEVVAQIKGPPALVAPQIAEIFARAQPFFQPIFDLNRRRSCSGASLCWAMPRSSRARMPGPA